MSTRNAVVRVEGYRFAEPLLPQELPTMPKLSSLFALASVAALLAGCAGAPGPEASGGIVVTPHPEWGMVSASVAQGSSVTIDGSGYEAGQQIFINLGIAQSDGMVMDEQSAIAYARGNYSITITIAADIPPGSYGVLTFVADGVRSGPEFEASKRFAEIEVVEP